MIVILADLVSLFKANGTAVDMIDEAAVVYMTTDSAAVVEAAVDEIDSFFLRSSSQLMQMPSPLERWYRLKLKMLCVFSHFGQMYEVGMNELCLEMLKRYPEVSWKTFCRPGSLNGSSLPLHVSIDKGRRAVHSR